MTFLSQICRPFSLAFCLPAKRVRRENDRLYRYTIIDISFKWKNNRNRIISSFLLLAFTFDTVVGRRIYRKDGKKMSRKSIKRTNNDISAEITSPMLFGILLLLLISSVCQQTELRKMFSFQSNVFITTTSLHLRAMVFFSLAQAMMFTCTLPLPQPLNDFIISAFNLTILKILHIPTA